MPRLEEYTVVTKVAIEVHTAQAGMVTSYSVVRKGSAMAGADGVPNLVEQTLVQAVAAEKAMRAGVHNAEGRRLK